jgi:hypothetical protein
VHTGNTYRLLLFYVTLGLESYEQWRSRICDTAQKEKIKSAILILYTQNLGPRRWYENVLRDFNENYYGIFLPIILVQYIIIGYN